MPKIACANVDVGAVAQRRKIRNHPDVPEHVDTVK